MGNTLRYGSGLLDVPVSSVVPHLMIRGTYSGFWSDLDRRLGIDASGEPVGHGPGGDLYADDAALTLGLFGRGEMGLSLQSFGSSDRGGDVWGLFGRLKLLEPVDQGIGFAVGGRFLTAPDFDDGTPHAPGRLGFSDERIRERSDGADGSMDTRLTMYGVATAYLRGFSGLRVPENDLTLSLGWGTGMFRDASATALYGAGSNGWFAGISSHWRISDASVIQIAAEHNGFDVNFGVQAEYAGARLGVHVLGANHPRPRGGYDSEYLSPKLGMVASFGVCPGRPRLRCRPSLMRRVEPDTIWIPPPPPDTVRVFEDRPPPPVGDAVSVCLSTGQNVPVVLTAAGDTLVGPDGTSIRELRPVVDFAGAYAAGTPWFERGEDIVFEQRRFYPSGAPFTMDCEQILRAGAYQGVPVFADRSVIRPLDVLFLPVRVGWWQRYVWGGDPSAGLSWSRPGRRAAATSSPNDRARQ